MLKDKNLDIPEISPEDLDIADISGDSDSNELAKEALIALRECMLLEDLKSLPVETARKIVAGYCKCLPRYPKDKYDMLRAGLACNPPTYQHVNFDLLYSEKVEHLNEAKVIAFAKKFSSFEILKAGVLGIKSLIGHGEDFDEEANLFVVVRKVVAAVDKADEIEYVSIIWKFD